MRPNLSKSKSPAKRPAGHCQSKCTALCQIGLPAVRRVIDLSSRPALFFDFIRTLVAQPHRCEVKIPAKNQMLVSLTVPVGSLYRFVFVNTLTGAHQEMALNEVFGRARGMYPAWHTRF